MRCLTCGVEIPEGSNYCDKCAAFAGGAPPKPAPTPTNPLASPPSAQASSDGLSKLVPYKNAPALIGYYLGVFSLIPCVGFFLAWFALGLGIWGLAHWKAKPDAGGKVHAWAAIIVGALVIVGHVAIFVLIARS